MPTPLRFPQRESTHQALEQQVDDEIQASLLRAVAAATATQRLTLLTLLENPPALHAVEALISALYTDGGR